MGTEIGSMKPLEWSWHHQYYKINAILGEIKVTQWFSTKLKATLKPMEISIHSLQDRACTWQAENSYTKRQPSKEFFLIQCTSFSAATHRSKTTKTTKLTKSTKSKPSVRAAVQVIRVGQQFWSQPRRSIQKFGVSLRNKLIIFLKPGRWSDGCKCN